MTRFRKSSARHDGRSMDKACITDITLFSSVTHFVNDATNEENGAKLKQHVRRVRHAFDKRLMRLRRGSANPHYHASLITRITHHTQHTQHTHHTAIAFLVMHGQAIAAHAAHASHHKRKHAQHQDHVRIISLENVAQLSQRFTSRIKIHHQGRRQGDARRHNEVFETWHFPCTNSLRTDQRKSLARIPALYIPQSDVNYFFLP